jgi:hypothetical protein
VKFSELRFTKYLHHQPVMHSQWLKDSKGNSWRVVMSLQTLHYKLSCLTPGVQELNLPRSPLYGPYNLTAADLQELIESLYPDE